MKDKCKKCSFRKCCRDSAGAWVFFIVGIIATIAIRAVSMLSHFDQGYGKAAWYIGVGGFLIFFMYKYRVGQERARLIEEHDLAGKLKDKAELSTEDYSLIEDLLCSLRSKKERINYFFIFALSAVVLIVAAYMDFIR